MATFRFDPELIQAATDVDLEQARRDGGGALLREYHAMAERLYESTLPNEREQAFAQLYARWFTERGWSDLFAEIWSQVSELDARASQCLVLAARLKREEGAVIGRDGASVCLRILPMRFANRAQLACYVRHELLHAADQLDKSFGYRLTRETTLTQTNQVADIYHTVWCACVDARLARRGWMPLHDADAHRKRFDTQLAAMPPEQRAALFEQVWHGPRLGHQDILELARAWSRAAAGQTGGAPGSRCPLCSFPTFKWATTLAPAVVDAIRSDFPQWRVEQGTCERCAERYELATKGGAV